MNCNDVSKLLASYLANEVSSSEKKLVQNHLAACEACQKKMMTLAALQSRIRQTLQQQAAEAAPSQQTWSRLQAQMEFPAHVGHPSVPLSWLTSWKTKMSIGVFTMKQTAFVILAVLVLLIGTAALVPGVRAAVVENIIGWIGYDFPSPNSQDILSWGTVWGFTPYNPRYMPKGLTLKGSMVAGESDATKQVGLCYQTENPQPGDPFIAIIETHLSSASTLPSGEAVTVKGANEGEGILDELPAGEVKWCLKSVSYEKALRLNFIKGDIQIQVFGLFEEKDLVRIANSLQEAEPAAEQPERPKQPTPQP